MLKSDYLNIENNEKKYRTIYYITLNLGIVGIIFLLVYAIMFKNQWLLTIVAFLLVYLSNCYYKSKYKQYIYIKKFEFLEGIEISNYLNLILNRLYVFKYKIKKMNNNFYKANKKSRNYGIYYVEELSDKNFKTNYSLSRKYKFRKVMKHSFEDYNLVNIILSNHINDDVIDLLHYDGINLSPNNEIFIGVDLRQGKVYVNYGANNTKNSFSKELYEIVTGMNR